MISWINFGLNQCQPKSISDWGNQHQLAQLRKKSMKIPTSTSVSKPKEEKVIQVDQRNNNVKQLPACHTGINFDL